MRMLTGLCLLVYGVFLGTNSAQAGDDARAIIAQAIKASGGVENLKKHQSTTWTEKGTYRGMGEGQPYVGKLAAQFPGQFRMQVLAGGMEVFTIVMNGDKGWIKAGGEVRELSKDELKKQQDDFKVGMISSLLPLEDKAFTLTIIDSIPLGEKGALAMGVKVTRKDYPEVKLYFDKVSYLLVKSEFKAFSSEKSKIVLAEFFFSNHKLIDGAQVPTRIAISHDGKTYVETDIHDLKTGKLTDEVFAAPK